MAVAVIPARLESVRFPRKVLASDTGRPLIIHVALQAAKAEAIDEVIIASDADEILAAAQLHGFRGIRTRSDHVNGTSRIAEVAQTIKADVIVNVQADEPEIDPGIIDAAIAALEAHPECQVGTVASPMGPQDDPADPNLVKVVLDEAGRAMYFSRAIIPHDRDGDSSVGRLRHVGLYVYRRSFLPIYASLSPTRAEQAEKLEQLRMLEHGFQIAVTIQGCHHQGIDTPDQYRAFVGRQEKIKGSFDNLD